MGELAIKETQRKQRVEARLAERRATETAVTIGANAEEEAAADNADELMLLVLNLEDLEDMSLF